MRFVLPLVLAAAAFAQPRPASATKQIATPKKPKLVLALCIDQFRYDYLTRFRSEYNSGFAKLLEKGAVFTNAHQDHFPTVTAVGHSTYLTGATPANSGIIANEWYDRATGKQVTSVTDNNVKTLGSDSKGAASPGRLLVDTVGDELKISGKGGKVIGISVKDRSAILPAGRMADGAYWFDNATGNFVSSTWYFADMPSWVKDYNANRPADKYANLDWVPLSGGKPFFTMPAPGPSLYSTLERSPWGNELISKFAQRAIEAEQLGRGGKTDLLAVSFSANDYVGHRSGPDSAEVHDMSVRTDRMMGEFLQFVDQKVGLDSVIVVLTADHGVAPVPEVNVQRKMQGGRVPEDTLIDAAEKAITAKFGSGKWIVGKAGAALYLNYALAAEKKVSPEAVATVAADAISAVPHVYAAYTKWQIERRELPANMVGHRVARGYNPDRSADVIAIADPYYLFEKGTGTSHGMPWLYDSHVPLIFMGQGVKPGRYYKTAAVNDVAPTLATLLDIETPAGAEGRVLEECLR